MRDPPSLFFWALQSENLGLAECSGLAKTLCGGRLWEARERRPDAKSA